MLPYSALALLWHCPTGTAQTASNNTLDAYFGQKVWRLNFTELATPGRYHIRVPGLGVSHTFLVSEDALRPLVGAMARGLYGQRAGDPLDSLFLSPWTRQEVCHQAGGEPMPVPPPKSFSDAHPVPNSQTTLLPDASGSYWLPQVGCLRANSGAAVELQQSCPVEATVAVAVVTCEAVLAQCRGRGELGHLPPACFCGGCRLRCCGHCCLPPLLLQPELSKL